MAPRVCGGQGPGGRFQGSSEKDARGNASLCDRELRASEGMVSEVKDVRGQREDEETDSRGETQLKVDMPVTNPVSKRHNSLTPGRTGETGSEQAEARSCLLC